VMRFLRHALPVLPGNLRMRTTTIQHNLLIVDPSTGARL
jgi:hypothetical protein